MDSNQSTKGESENPSGDAKSPSQRPTTQLKKPQLPASMDSEISRSEMLDQCQQAIGYHFEDLRFLVHALTHSSSATHKLKSNERLEFLGDSILGFCVCEYLFQEFPNLLEGELTRIKSVVVSGSTCAKMSRRLGLQEFLILGKGMEQKNPPQSLLSDVFESIVAAIFLDSGIEDAKRFVLTQLQPEFDLVNKNRLETNYKSQLQQVTQKDYQISPVYKHLEDSGPDHQKSFHACVVLGETEYPSAWGKSKKEAEQLAAKHALSALPTCPPKCGNDSP